MKYCLNFKWFYINQCFHKMQTLETLIKSSMKWAASWENRLFGICKNKDADQLCRNHSTDQCLIFATQIVQSLFFLNPKFQASCHPLKLYSQLCRTWSETPKTGFVMTRLILCCLLRLNCPKLMDLSHYNVLANVCQRMKILSKTLAYVKVEWKKSEKALTWTNTKRMQNVLNVYTTYV